MKRMISFFAAALFATAVWADPDVTLSGTYTADQTVTATSDTTIVFAGASFTDASLILSGNVTFTLQLEDKTENVFEMDNNKPAINAAGADLLITGSGELDLTSTKRIKNSGVLVCRNLTVAGGDTTVTFDQDKSDTSCIFLTGNYRQTNGKMKVDLHKKNVTNEFYGVTLDTKNTTFSLEGGKFNAEIAGTKSRAIDIKKSCTATFSGGEAKAEFEGPEGRFVNGGTIVFQGGSFTFTTNITSKMTAAYYPTSLSAVKAAYSITIEDGTFEADLPLLGSEAFTTDSETGTDIVIRGGDFDLVTGDDGISATRDILISGGRVRGVSVFDDVIDANRNIQISGGTVRAFATMPETHGIDVNEGFALTINGGNIVATDGPSAEKESVTGSQTVFYGNIQASSYSGKYITVAGVEDGAPATTKVRLPEFSTDGTAHLLVSVPGMAADWTPVAKTAAEAYADANSRTPLVFERKASVSGSTVTTKEGEVITLPSYYDLSPDSGKTKTVELSLNTLATPVFAQAAVDGVDGIAVEGDEATLGVRTLSGLRYQVQKAASLAAPIEWTDVGTAADGTGSAVAITVPATENSAFFRISAED